MSEEKKGLLNRLWLIDMHRKMRVSRPKPVKQPSIAVTWKARLGVNAIGVEWMIPHPKQRRRDHDSVVGRGANKVLCWWLAWSIEQDWAKTALLSADGLETRA